MFSFVMLMLFLLNVAVQAIMPSVILQSAVELSVAAPYEGPHDIPF
jgi:hypothetical protein